MLKKRVTKRLGKKKVLLVMDNALLYQMDDIVKQMDSSERMDRSKVIQEILYWVIEEDLLNDILPYNNNNIIKVIKEKFSKKHKRRSRIETS